jgi:hypothetical protein
VVVSIPHPMQLTRRGVAELAALSGRPELCDENLPDRRIAECCRRRGVPMVAGKGHLSRSDYKRREGIHWNERGHRRMATVLGRLYESFRSDTLDEYVPHALVDSVEDGVAHPSASLAGPMRSAATDLPLGAERI